MDDRIILLVEDDEDNVVLTRFALRDAGISNRVVVARDGVEALALLLAPAAALRPVLVLLDIRMPRMSGAEVLKRLKADPETQRIPVILVTVVEPSDEEFDPIYRQAASHVMKPYDSDQLLEEVRKVLPPPRR